MIIQVKRNTYTENSTIGEMWINGVFEAYTLEDKMREVFGKPVAEWKVMGRTAIPTGTYDLVIDLSTRFKRLMPHIIAVPGFEGVRIHALNTPLQTEGCIGIGKTRAIDFIGQSKMAFDSFFARIQDAVAIEHVTITITNE